MMNEDDAKRQMLKELLKQIHGKMGQGYEEEGPSEEEGMCPDCGEPMCACDKEESEGEEEMKEEQPEEYAEGEEMAEEQGEDDEGDLMEQLKSYMKDSNGMSGPSTPKVGLPLGGMSVTEIEVSKPKKKFGKKKSKY
mgnify:CR=1 FL=1